MLSVGRNIRRLRREFGLTQEQVAKKLGVTYQCVSKWENETSAPDIERLPDIAVLFGVTIDTLFVELDIRTIIEQKRTKSISISQ